MIIILLYIIILVSNDEILLDPVLTNKNKNNVEAKILPTFFSKLVDHYLCHSKRILIIFEKITEKFEKNKYRIRRNIAPHKSKKKIFFIGGAYILTTKNLFIKLKIIYIFFFKFMFKL